MCHKPRRTKFQRSGQAILLPLAAQPSASDSTTG